MEISFNSVSSYKKKNCVMYTYFIPNCREIFTTERFQIQCFHMQILLDNNIVGLFVLKTTFGKMYFDLSSEDPTGDIPFYHYNKSKCFANILIIQLQFHLSEFYKLHIQDDFSYKCASSKQMEIQTLYDLTLMLPLIIKFLRGLPFHKLFEVILCCPYNTF